jgi:predicted amidohydrolase
MNIVSGDKQANLKTAMSYIDEAGNNGVEIVCFPEMFNTGLVFKTIKKFAETESGETLGLLCSIAKRKKIAIIAGSIPIKEKSYIYNAAYVINKKGKIIGNYKKIHTFSPIGEHKHIKSGSKINIFTLGKLKVGLMICYDIRFPELARNLALKGANILFVPAQFPNPRSEHWKILLKARAIENQVYVAGVNRVGADESRSYFGYSMILDPWGNILSKAGEEPTIIYADIDQNEIRKTRKVIPCFKDRRCDVY